MASFTLLLIFHIAKTRDAHSDMALVWLSGLSARITYLAWVQRAAVPSAHPPPPPRAPRDTGGGGARKGKTPLHAWLTLQGGRAEQLPATAAPGSWQGWILLIPSSLLWTQHHWALPASNLGAVLGFPKKQPQHLAPAQLKPGGLSALANSWLLKVQGQQLFFGSCFLYFFFHYPKLQH